MNSTETSKDFRRNEEIRGLFVLGLLAVMVTVRIQTSTIPITLGQLSFDLIPWLDITISLWSLYAFFMVLGLSEDIIGKTVSKMFAETAKSFLRMNFVLLAFISLLLGHYAYPTRLPWVFYLIMAIFLCALAVGIRDVLRNPPRLNLKSRMRANLPIAVFLGLVFCVYAIMYLPEQYIQISFILGVILVVVYFVLKERQKTNANRSDKSIIAEQKESVRVTEYAKMSSEEEKKRDELIYKIVVERYDLEWKRTNDLDSKASSVTGFAGLLATLTAGIAEFFPKAHYQWLFLIPLTLFILSAVFGLLAYWITSFEAINPDALIQGYGNRTEIEALRAFTATTSKHTMRNYSLNQRKVWRIYGAFILLVLAIGLFFVFAIINLIM